MSKKTDFNKEIYTDEKGGIDWAKLESGIRGYTRFQDQIRLLDMCLKAFGIKKNGNLWCIRVSSIEDS